MIMTIFTNAHSQKWLLLNHLNDAVETTRPLRKSPFRERIFWSAHHDNFQNCPFWSARSTFFKIFHLKKKKEKTISLFFLFFDVYDQDSCFIS